MKDKVIFEVSIIDTLRGHPEALGDGFNGSVTIRRTDGNDLVTTNSNAPHKHNWQLRCSRPICLRVEPSGRFGFLLTAALSLFGGLGDIYVPVGTGV